MSKTKHTGNGHRTETPDVSHIRNVEVTHELSDIHVGGVLSFGAVLTVLTIGVYIGIWLLFGYFASRDRKEPGPGPMALSQQERLPPEPRLQAAKGFGVTLENGQSVSLELRQPQAEYRVLRMQWEQDLKAGSKDGSGNTIGLPIDDAMKKILTDGLPTRTTEAPAKLQDYAVSLPTAASSGRVSEKRVQ